MFGWRRRSEGFEWNEYVRTTVLVRRADRQRRLDDVRLAALTKVKDAADRGVEAGKAGVEDVRGRFSELMSAIADTAWAGLVKMFRALRQTLSRIAAKARQTLRALPIPEIPFLSGLKFPAVRPWFKMPAISFGRLFAPDKLVTAGALALVVIVGGRMLSPTLPAATPAARVVTASVTAAEPASEAADELTGRASAVSGDSLRVDRTIVHLKGIEAPDARQLCVKANGRRWSCGLEAKDGLARIVRGKTVTCNVAGTDAQGRPLADCATGDTDIAAEAVRLGLVFAETGILRAFASEEGTAKAAKAGLWQGTAERPAEWRQRLWDEAKRQAPDGCPIKGYVRGGGHIYALPWSNDYQNSLQRNFKGERWFCSEDEARAAGFKLSVRS